GFAPSVAIGRAVRGRRLPPSGEGSRCRPLDVPCRVRENSLRGRPSGCGWMVAGAEMDKEAPDWRSGRSCRKPLRRRV
ncbi:MAG: hypothetical protein AVDCRST_MAG89-3050, partial [uncultured Gemmatimonadetes bacterium]